MPYSQWQQTSEHGRTKYYIDPNARKLIEATGSTKINGWSVTFYSNEWGRFEVIAYRPIKKRDDKTLVNNTLEFKLETTALIPKFIPIEKQKWENHNWINEIFVELDDGKDLIVEEFNQYQGYGKEPYGRKYARSSIVKAYDFLKQYLPEFEDMIKDKTVAEHASKIINKAEKL